MPPLAIANRFAAIDKQQILRHVNFPFLDIAIVHEILKRQPELSSEILQRLRPATTEVAQGHHFDRIGLCMAGNIQLQPARQVFALEREPLLPLDQGMRHFAVERTQIGIKPDIQLRLFSSCSALAIK